MKPFSFMPAVFAGPAALLLSSLAYGAAPAPTERCGDGPACAFGFECGVIGSSGCGATPACAPGASCPEPEPCVVTEEYGCRPASCQADRDCATGMVCHEWVEPCAVTDCACPPDSKCECDPPSGCDPKTVSMCTPRYLLPCETALDCGPGFSCEEAQRCGCSSSGGGEAPRSGSGAAPLPPQTGGAGPADEAPTPPDCSCEPSGTKQCALEDIACENDAGCPSGWSCQGDNGAETPDCGGDGCGARPAPPPPSRTCRPPYYSGTRDDVGGPVAPVSGEDGQGAPSGSPNAGPSSPSTESAAGHESSACQFGPARSGTGSLSLLAVLGALFGVARRRRVK